MSRDNFCAVRWKDSKTGYFIEKEENGYTVSHKRGCKLNISWDLGFFVDNAFTPTMYFYSFYAAVLAARKHVRLHEIDKKIYDDRNKGCNSNRKWSATRKSLLHFYSASDLPHRSPPIRRVVIDEMGRIGQ